MPLSRAQRVFIITANLLGAKIFKRYWPMGGSFWNKKHINPRRRYDLESVIDESWDYTQQHARAFVTEAIIMGMAYFTGYFPPGQVIGSIPIIVTIHGYAMMIHQYNRILANARLESLPPADTKPLVNAGYSVGETSHKHWGVYWD